MLADCCEGFNCVLTSTGYLAGDERNPELARAKVREDTLIKAGHITDLSQTFRRRIEDVSSANGNAYRDLRRRGPFQIVNLDACGSIAPRSANHATRLVDAIYRIVELQLELSVGRWLMFVTADVRRTELSDETIVDLGAAILQNARDNDNFDREVLSLLDASAESTKLALENISKKDSRQFLQFFSLGFAKWLLHLAADKKWNMKMHNAYCYSTAPAPDDSLTMPCLAFEFVPPPRGLRDRFSLTNADPAAGGITEDTSIRAIEIVGNIVDIDQLILADATLRRNMIDNTKILLEEAGYAASTLAALEDFDSSSI